MIWYDQTEEENKRNEKHQMNRVFAKLERKHILNNNDEKEKKG